MVISHLLSEQLSIELLLRIRLDEGLVFQDSPGIDTLERSS